MPEVVHQPSTATVYKWRAKFGGMDTSMMTRIKELEDEERRLRKMYLEEKLKAEIANEYLAKSNSAVSQARD
jgi:putative transposase